MLKIFDKLPNSFGRNIWRSAIKLWQEGGKFMDLGSKILELRKKQQLSQEKLGEKVGVTRQTISNWELNETLPDTKQLIALSQALLISIDELVGNNTQNLLEQKVEKVEEKITTNNNLTKLIIALITLVALLLIIFVSAV